MPPNPETRQQSILDDRCPGAVRGKSTAAAGEGTVRPAVRGPGRAAPSATTAMPLPFTSCRHCQTVGSPPLAREISWQSKE